MFEKKLEIGYLLDFYGELLHERRREALELYYNDDMSLSEIGEALGITRQGARELIKKAGDELLFFEEKLGLAAKFRTVEQLAARATELIGSGDGELYGIIAEIKDTLNK